MASPARAARVQTGDVRLLIVMGGGTWENSVFRFFDTLDGVQCTLADSDREAFVEDLRARYDAILMYNLGGTLPERERGHLVQLLAGGGGLMVLHHALASYGNWPWWREEVVGGRKQALSVL